MKKSENILLLGLGGMGEYLARRLSHEGHHVTVIESDRQRLNEADAELDARLIYGDATRFECWAEADAKFNMLVGRLEMFSALVVFYPSFWRNF